MAERFRGRFSPGDGDAAEDGWDGRRPRRAGARANALFVAPIPLVVMAFGRDPAGLALNLAAFGVLMAAAFMTREGLRAEAAYDARRVAKRPALPRKLIGTALVAAGLALAGASDPVAAAIFAGLGAVLHFMAFGPDPLSDKGIEGVDAFQTDRVARAVDEAEAHLGEMARVAAATGDRPLEIRVGQFAATARKLFRSVEEDPRDLTGARRWLGVYLLGARDATVKYAELASRRPDAQARADYVALLDDLEEGFAQRTRKMLLDDRSDLDVEIEVLRDRLAREDVPVRSRERE